MKLTSAEHDILFAAKFAHIKRLATAGHTPLTQGYSFECAKCGLSGTLSMVDASAEMCGDLSSETRCGRE